MRFREHPSWELSCQIIREGAIALKNREQAQIWAADVATDELRRVGIRKIWIWVAN